MWVEIIVGGRIVTFTNVGMYLNSMGNDPRCEWASKIEAQARKLSPRPDDVDFRCKSGDLRIWIRDEAVQAVVRAITEAELSIPEDIRWFFQRICWLLEHREGTRVMDLPSTGVRRSIED